MYNLILINFTDNLFFYNFLNQYYQNYHEQFQFDFNILCIEGNFPHSFFSEYNYTQLDNYQVIDQTKILKLLKNNNLSLCLDLNNINLKPNDLIDKYLLTILLTLNNKNYYIHCNQHYICELLYSQNFNYTYIDDTYFQTINSPIKQLNEEKQIYNFSKIKTQFLNQSTDILKQLHNKQNIYRIMINDKNELINLFLLPQYQFMFYQEFLKYEKTL